MALDAFLSRLPFTMPREKSGDGALLFPRDADELTHIMEQANQYALSLQIGQTLQTGQVTLCFKNLNQVIRHRSEELILTVQSGISIAELLPILNTHNQRLAHLYRVDRTLLSIFAEELPSLSETVFGPSRLRVLGVEAITGDGIPFHYGAEVVKNVTGYPLHHLLVGTQNQYGLMTQLTLKLEAKPEVRRSFLFHVEDMHQALDLLRAVGQHTQTAEVLTLFKTKQTYGWQVLVSMAGYQASVQAESELIHEWMGTLNADLQELFLAPKALEQWIARLDWLHPEEHDALVIKIALDHKRALDLPYHFSTQPWLKSADMIIPWQTNQVWLRWTTYPFPSLQELEALQQQLAHWGGWMQIKRSPTGWEDCITRTINLKQDPVLQTWQDRLKNQFDPNGILPCLARHEYEKVVS